MLSINTLQIKWLALLIIISIGVSCTADSAEKRVVCYYTNWSVYRPGTAKFSPQNINPYLCTHLIYAFGGFTKENSFKPFDKYQDIEKGGYAKFTGLKTYNKNLKTLLAIGGWNEGSSRFSPMVASADRRKELVKNAIKFLRLNHFDGLDLDWEYPSFRDGGKPRDRDNYAQLVQELREEFDREAQKTGRPKLLLTMAVPAGIEYIKKGYDIPKLNKYLDWMNILSYDYHSAFEPAVNHHSPLFSLEEASEYNYDSELNIDYTIKHYLESGADKEKLVLGIPTYGRSYTLFNPDANAIGSPADGPGNMGDATRENGYLAYYEICENIKNGWTVVQPNRKAMGPYAYKDNQWVGYDDEDIVKKKAEYVAENGLGGIMFWAIDNDDFRGTCHGKPYPLIEAGKEALMSASTSSESNAITGYSKITSKSRGRNRRPISDSSTTETTHSNSGGRQGFAEEEVQSRRKPLNRVNSRFREESDTQEANKNQRTKSNNRIKTGRRRLKTTAATTTTTSTTPRYSGTTPSYTTPEPPTTPDPGSDFKCEDEGFFPHPRDCKKYFWCLSSGPSELGIVAHQFTCPSGLYFNKAADSCDYTQNVFCNKKKAASTTAASAEKTDKKTASTTTTTASPVSTSRVPPKITAATSRTTFLQTTTTTTPPPEYEEEYEYEDDDDEINFPRKGDLFDSEEDPKVIKELVELIKKLGGVDELEKHLRVQDDGRSLLDGTASTTPATISRSLYERVLNKATKSSDIATTQKGTSRFINSRQGPQGLKQEEDATKKDRPKYTTISRQKQTFTDDDAKYEDEVTEKAAGKIDYVTIRRGRPAANDDKSSSGSINSRLENSRTTEGASNPEYVTIRRQRPVTQEAVTSKYKTIVRSRPSPDPVEADDEDNEPATTEQSETEKSFTRSSQTAVPFEEAIIVRGKEVSSTSSKSTIEEDVTVTESLPLVSQPRPFAFAKRTRPTTVRTTTTEKATESPTPPPKATFFRRPVSRRVLPTTRRTTPLPKTSTTSYSSTRTSVIRRRYRPRDGSTTTTTTTTATTTATRGKDAKDESAPSLTAPKSRFAHAATTRKPVTARVVVIASDQSIEPSNQRAKSEEEGEESIGKENSAETTELADLAQLLDSLQKAPIPSSTAQREQEATTRLVQAVSSTAKPFKLISPSSLATFVATTPHTLLTTPHDAFVEQRRPRPQPFAKITLVPAARTFRPIRDYDYYDEGEARIVGEIPANSKVLIHSSGAIQCLDQGNFPHPISCKKFISCAKMENGEVIGWEYTCPNTLSFDPIGGICNWSAGLGCKE